MTTPGLFLIRDQIFGHLSYEDLESCCEVSDSWNESLNKKSSLKRQAMVKYLLEFGGRHVPMRDHELKNVREVIPGWNKGVKKVGSKASLNDLKEIKESLLDVANKFYNGNLVFGAAKNGDVKLMKLFFETSYDMNSRESVRDGNIFVEACRCSKSTEMVELIIRSSKDHRIDLNMWDLYGRSGFHFACGVAPLEIAKLLLKNYKEFGIDIMHEDRGGYTALDHLKKRLEHYVEEGIENGSSIYFEEGTEEWEEWEEFKSNLEDEFAKNNSLDNAA